MNGIRKRLEGGLALLAAAASGDVAYTSEHLEDLAPLAMPLLASPLVRRQASGLDCRVAVHISAMIL